MKIYVSDSFHTKLIADILQELYGAKATVVCELVFQPVDDPLGTIVKMFTDDIEPAYENKTSVENIDLFFISARAVIENQLNISELKKKYANPNARVIVMSVSPSYLYEIKRGGYDADFFLDKNIFIDACTAQALSESDRQLLLSYLN
jgi:hypothetical protein